MRERHHDGEVVNELVAVPADGGGEPVVLAAGRDFYASPRVSPDGRRLAWLEWDHPNMPWDGTELRLAELAGDALAGDPVTVAGGPEESVFQPEWSPDGVLHLVSDRTGWWNLYRVGAGGGLEALAPAEEEFGTPSGSSACRPTRSCPAAGSPASTAAAPCSASASWSRTAP